MNTQYSTLNLFLCHVCALRYFFMYDLSAHIGRHLEKYSIVEIKSALNVFLAYEYIVNNAQFASISCPCAEIW